MSDSVVPGLHDFSHEFYSSDPCPEPSLDSRGIRLLLEASPAHFAAQHARLTRWPDQLRTKQRDESLGAVIRSLVLNKGHEVAALPFDDWTTKQAQFQRRRARDAGQIPTTRHVFEQASTVADLAQRQLAPFHASAGTLQCTDATLLWHRQARLSDYTRIWCRERADELRGHGTVVLVQTLARAANDNDISKAVQNSALDLRAAWLLDGLSALFPKRLYRAIVVTIETEPPYLAIAKPLSDEWLDDARARIGTAVKGFVTGLKIGWPYLSSSAPLQQPLSTKPFQTRRD